MRLPILAASAIRSRGLIAPRERVLVALSGGADSVALLHCMLELSRKRDLAFGISAAHLNHGIRGKDADADERFCERLCAKLRVALLSAFVDVPALAKTLKRSMEETARIARHAFLASAVQQGNFPCVAVGHHADDRIETVLYRICRGTGLAGLQGIGWRGPLRLENEPAVDDVLEWRATRGMRYFPARSSGSEADRATSVVRPLLGCSRKEILAYLRSKRQRFRTDETNFDLDIPRNAIRNRILPLLEEMAHPGARGALWRLAEEAEARSGAQRWRREWLLAFARLASGLPLKLPVERGQAPSREEVADALEALRSVWGLREASFSHRHLEALGKLFDYRSGPKRIDLPGGLLAERSGKTVMIAKKA